MILNYINLIAVAYFGNNLPLKEPSKNKLELFNEFFVQIASLLFLCFTDWVSDNNAKEIIGYSLILLIFIYIVVNFVFIFKKIGG